MNRNEIKRGGCAHDIEAERQLFAQFPAFFSMFYTVIMCYFASLSLSRPSERDVFFLHTSFFPRPRQECVK